MSFRPKKCPNLSCSSSLAFIRKGHFRIRRLNQKIRKFQCKVCRKVFSSRTLKPDYRHKKMDLNFKLAKLLVEGNSLRSCSRILQLSYSNTYRKFLWLKKIVELKRGEIKFSARKIQFDELETIHHTKCKPLSVALVVSEEYLLLEAQVAEMPAKGRLAEISRKKYGPRIDQRKDKLHEGFRSVVRKLNSQPELIESDQRSGYQQAVSEHFPSVRYVQHNRSEKDRLQARLHEKHNKKKFDPLFAINHKCALLRSHIKRLTRRSWCTTKKPENLQLHLDIFIMMQFVEAF